jgi:NAD(P)-dependent dehydrogenase (short-subunit alcohol dehydrogenase family)
MNLMGVAAFVTGGASGLGEATARRLAGGGVRVAVFDRDADRAAAVADALGGLATAGDVADEASVAGALEAAAARNGEARILVNCAGIGFAERTVGKDGPHGYAAFERVIRVNLLGSFNCIRLFAARAVRLDALAGGERGVIVNTASVAAYDGQIGQAAYSASKGGIVGMTLPIARDLARHGIRVCTIAPGLFRTPLLAGLPQAAQDSLSAAVPFPSRLGEPDEYARLVQHICENAMLNGETIRLDGALRMAPK